MRRSVSAPCCDLHCLSDSGLIDVEGGGGRRGENHQWFSLFGLAGTGSGANDFDSLCDVGGDDSVGGCSSLRSRDSFRDDLPWMEALRLKIDAPTDPKERREWFSYATYLQDRRLAEMLVNRPQWGKEQQQQQRSAAGSKTWNGRDDMLRKAKLKIKEVSSSTDPSPTTSDNEKYLKQQLREQVNLWQEKYTRLEQQHISEAQSAERELAALKAQSLDREKTLQKQCADLSKECEDTVKKRLMVEESKTEVELRLQEVQREMSQLRQAVREERFEHSKSLKTLQKLERELDSAKERYTEALSEIERAQNAKQKAVEGKMRMERELRQKEAEVGYYKGEMAKHDVPLSLGNEDVHASCKQKYKAFVERSVKEAATLKDQCNEATTQAGEVKRDNERLNAELTRLRKELQVSQETTKKLEAQTKNSTEELQQVFDTCSTNAQYTQQLLLAALLDEENSKRCWLQAQWEAASSGIESYAAVERSFLKNTTTAVVMSTTSSTEGNGIGMLTAAGAGVSKDVAKAKPASKTPAQKKGQSKAS